MILDKNELSEYIGKIVSETYGVIGLVKKTNSFNKLTLLKSNHYTDGISISSSNDKYVIEVHVCVLSGLKVTEIASEIYKRLYYFLKNKYGDNFKKIYIYIDDVQEL